MREGRPCRDVAEYPGDSTKTEEDDENEDMVSGGKRSQSEDTQYERGRPGRASGQMMMMKTTIVCATRRPDLICLCSRQGLGHGDFPSRFARHVVCHQLNVGTART